MATYTDQLQPANINDAWTAYRAGEGYYQLQQPEKALPWYKRATEIWPYALDFESKYGTCLLMLKKYGEAQKVFAFIINENLDYTVANTNLGYLYMQQGNQALSYHYLQRANELDPDNEQTLINLAVWFHGNGQNEQAAKYLTNLLRRHPDNQQAKAMLADLRPKM